jgi:septum formation topological specificity factor MinE
MPRQQINLEPFREEIISLFHHGVSSDAISRTLESRHNIQVKERTIQSRLRKWGIRKRHRTTTSDEALHSRIQMLFVEERLTDKAMLRVLQQEGYGISERTLRRLRFKLGLHARASSEQEQSQNQQDQPQAQESLPLLLARVVPQSVTQPQPV